MHLLGRGGTQSWAILGLLHVQDPTHAGQGVLWEVPTPDCICWSQHDQPVSSVAGEPETAAEEQLRIVYTLAAVITSAASRSPSYRMTKKVDLVERCHRRLQLDAARSACRSGRLAPSSATATVCIYIGSAFDA